MKKQTRSERNKVLYIEMTPAEHGVLKVEAAISGRTMGDVIRERLIKPLMERHVSVLRKIGVASR